MSDTTEGQQDTLCGEECGVRARAGHAHGHETL